MLPPLKQRFHNMLEIAPVDKHYEELFPPTQMPVLHC